VEQAELWGARVAARSELPVHERVERMYLAAFGRPPDAEELAAAVEFVRAQSRDQAPGGAQPWSALAHVLFNVKEFIFLN
jgi:hypothetical protein